MLVMILRKMINNRWMMFCLLIGSIISVAVISSISMYTHGILQRMLTRDLEDYQGLSGKYPGDFVVEADLQHRFNPSATLGIFEKVDEIIKNRLSTDIKLPIISHAQKIFVADFIFSPEGEENEYKYVKVEAVSQLQEHVRLIGGRMFSNHAEKDVYEVMVTEEAMKNLDLVLDRVYVLSYSGNRSKEISVKVVGVFTVKDTQDIYWYQGLEAYGGSVMIDYGQMREKLLKESIPVIYNAQWHYAYDYRKINLDSVKSILGAYDSHLRWYKKNGGFIKSDMSFIPLIKEYREREKQLTGTLLILQVPVILMLAFYTIMVSKLAVDFDGNEIAVIKSRGASGYQIFYAYFAEGSLLGILALIIGPFLALFLCTLLGASNGFLEFANRAALKISFSYQAFLYSLGAAVLFIATMLLPALSHSRNSIVLHKQKSSRQSKPIFWKKYFLDIITLGISCYGLFSYQRQQKVIEAGEFRGIDMTIDPLLFLISTFFILGAGLIFLRVYPYIIRLIYNIGERYWSPVMYITFIQTARVEGQAHLLMLFLILTLSTGIFSANSARTINENMVQRIRYENGADIILKPYWMEADTTDWSDMSWADEGDSDGGTGGSGAAAERTENMIEPPFEPYTELTGVEKATKVFKRFNASVQYGGDWVTNVYLMGVIPDEFARVAWFKPSLLPLHWYHYLNFMTDVPPAAIISTSLERKYGIKEGDTITVSWGRENYLDVVVYGIVDYWPSFNPHISRAEFSGRQMSPYLVVANLNYFHAKYDVERYEVWIKKEDGISSNQIYLDMIEKELVIEEKKDSDEEIIKRRNDPMLQGTNGALTLNFIVTMIISMMGFMIYWIMSIKRRVLQFGVLRAMGMSARKLGCILAWEQILISGTSAMVGIIIGNWTSRIFVPLLQISYRMKEQILPFEVISLKGDHAKLYLFVAVMFVFGLLVLGNITFRIRMDQAVKLGED